MTSSSNRQDKTAPLLVLASGSPRRSQILGEAGIPFEVIVSGIDELTRPGERPEDLALRLASEKCLDVATRLPADPPRPVLGADTIVVSVDDEVLGKPNDEAHAALLLEKIVGTTHRVMTGVAVAWTDGRSFGTSDPDPDPDPDPSGTLTCLGTSFVTMRSATFEELVEYVAVGESLDKAGGYALQGEGARFIVGVEGSRTNVIGLPIDETRELLRQAGLPAAGLGQ